MSTNDTIALLQESHKGTQMAVKSLEDALPHAQKEPLQEVLQKSLAHHRKINDALETELTQTHQQPKSPGAIAEAMSWLTLNWKLASGSDIDKEIAKVITNGCNMGIESLSSYQNQYTTADERAVDFAKRLIKIEEELSVDLRPYL